MQNLTSTRSSIRHPHRAFDDRAPYDPPTHLAAPHDRRWRAGVSPPAMIGAAIALGLVAAACGDQVQASRAWCEAVGELDATLAEVGEPDPETLRTVFSGLDEVATTIADRAPGRARSASSKVERAIDAGAESGEPTLFEPTVSTAMAEMHVYAAEECAYEQVSVVATDYAFGGIPDTVPAGKLALAFENESSREAHEIVLFLKSEGVDLPMAELLTLPEAEAMTKARPIGFTMADPNGRNGLILDLEPGNYAAVCFVPVGGADDGEPHFAHGMVTDFVVG